MISIAGTRPARVFPQIECICSDVSDEHSKTRIRFCVNNPRNLAERNDLIARGYECLGCLGNCTECFETRFLEIDNAFVTGASYDEMLKNIEDTTDQK